MEKKQTLLNIYDGVFCENTERHLVTVFVQKVYDEILTSS